MRKIIHCDCDCFYASVEMRDDPMLRGRPIAIGGSSQRRGVVATCNYEARSWGVRSAMPTGQAMRLCPSLIVIPPNMDKYRNVAADIREVFLRYTEVIEPLSLDEAYLDVSRAEMCKGSATLIAQQIRSDVQRELGITISAGVAPNKFLAKVASDWQKPDGLTVITPDKVEAFVSELAVGKIHGVGQVMCQRLNSRGIYTCGDLQQLSLAELVRDFGRMGRQLYDYARGIDNRELQPDRQRKSLSVERTFATDIVDGGNARLALSELLAQLRRRLNDKADKLTVNGVFVKLKSCDFRLTTVEQALIGGWQEQSFQRLLAQAWSRLDSPVRLIGAGVRFAEPKECGGLQGGQLALF